MLVKELDMAPLDAFAALSSIAMPVIFSGGRGRQYSYAMAEPTVIIKTTGLKTFVETEGEKAALSGKDQFTAVSDSLKDFETKRGETPFPFTGGMAGYFSYDIKDSLGFKRSRGRPALRPPDDINAPAGMAGIYGVVFVYDHVRGQGFLVCNDPARFKRPLDRIRSALEQKKTPMDMRPPAPPGGGGGFASNMTRDEFMLAVKKAKAYIEAGDVYQINLSHRLSMRWDGDPFLLYLRLLKDVAMPFCTYMDMAGFQILSNSPERLLKVEDGVVETSPIKGTRPRGATEEEDAKKIEELKRSAKERAEHVMVVDLERNDLGAICEPGSVHVEEFEAVKTFPGLHHMVSTITGRPLPGMGALDCLRAVFPGGSITGAPKFRAVEIIDELETTRRGIYTGALGWCGFDGAMDMSIAIRTAVCKGGRLYLNVGAGIVADSAPSEEHEETILKAKGFFDALAGNSGDGQ